MSHYISQTASNLHSLVDWLALSGVTIEVGDVTAFQAQATKMAERMVQQESTVENTQEISKPVAAPRAPAQPILNIPEFKSLDELNSFSSAWKDFSLSKTASRAVIGQGSTEPHLIVISDMPEDHEDRSGTPFSSPAGELIRKALSFTDIPSDHVYYTYHSKWRSPGKRSLTSYEAEICTILLRQEIKLLGPKAVLMLGESVQPALWPDSAGSKAKLPLIKNEQNNIVNYLLPVMSSQKAELLLKNPLMKKKFWFSLLEIAAAIRIKE